MTDNAIVSNTGGGLCLDYSSNATLTNNTIKSNTADDGCWLYLYGSNADLRDDIVAGNVAGNDGSGLYVSGSSLVLSHLTLARNRGNAGVYVTGHDDWGWYYSHIVMTDTILVGHIVGIYVNSGASADLQATLWGSGAWANGTDYGGAGDITTGTVNLWGDPGFVNPDAGDYHILPTSAAVDAGVDAGVTSDMDGDPHPSGSGYDIGADECLCHPLITVTISGQASGTTDTAYTFAVLISPADATTPIHLDDAGDAHHHRDGGELRRGGHGDAHHHTHPETHDLPATRTAHLVAERIEMPGQTAWASPPCDLLISDEYRSEAQRT